MHVTLREDIEKLTPALRRFARALVSHEADDLPEAADTLVQEVLSRAWRADWSRRLVDPRVFLYSAVIAANRQRLRARPANPVASDGAAGRPAGTASQGSSGRSHAARLPLPGRQGGITEALDLLAREEREAFLLVVLEGLSYSMAGDVLCVPRSVLLARLVKAHQALEQGLETGGAPDQRGRRPAYLRVVK